MDPIDYSGAFANIQPPIQAFTQGLQGGVALQQVQAEQAQQQAAQAQKQQMQTDLAALSANPTPQAIAAASLKYPQLSEQFKRSLDMLTPAQQQAKIDAAGPVHAAVLAGEYGIAAKQLREHADAAENAGNDQEAKQTRAMADMIEKHPETAKLTTGMLLASAMGPERYTKAFGDIGSEQRAADLAPGAVRKANADAGAAEADVTEKNLAIVAQKAGALAKPGVKPEQAQTMFRTLAAQGLIPKADLQGYLDGIPTDPKALPDYLKQVQASGMKPDEQMKFTTPTADAALSAATQVQTTGMNNATSIRTTGMNNATQLKVQEAIDERKGGDVDQKQVENVASMIASGRMAPLGAMAMRTPFGQAVMSLVAENNPSYRAQDFGTSSKAEKDFATGKQGNAVRSFNVGLSHLDTLGSLADAMGNKDMQAVNRIGNYFATQTGAEAPVKFEAAKKVVTDEIVKAIVGAGGTGHDREEAAKTVSAASSPAQLRGVINTYKELMVGQLGGLDQQYRTSTGRDDFHKLLSPQAQTLYGKHGGGASPAAHAAAAPSIPAGWSVREH
jgi:hypothetical protein